MPIALSKDEKMDKPKFLFVVLAISSVVSLCANRACGANVSVERIISVARVVLMVVVRLYPVCEHNIL